jgi:pimeloyl-ACP methyl ester carboxylesterase
MAVSRRRVAGIAVLAALAVGLLAGAARPAGTSCGRTAGLRCLTVEVPLDRSGRVAGRIPLHAEVLPADPQRGVMFLVAGGPGQGSADVFQLGVPEYAGDFQDVVPGYTLVAVDGRGTGRSGPLRCPMLNPAHLEASAPAAECARALGPRRDFYGTADHAEDLEAVRVALGYDSIGLFGVSYGTKLALAYALAHPGRVSRLLLDSVSLPEGDNPFLAGFYSRFPATLARYCANAACRSATRDFAGDVAAVANALAAKPIRGTVLQPGGARRAEELDGLGFLSLVVESDLNPGVAAELPAAAHAARAGDTAPLLRAYELALKQADTYGSVNLGLFMATTCRDGPFPWTPQTPLPDRPRIVSAAIAALPGAAFGPFGRWAARSGNAQACLGWPSPNGGASLGRGPLPDVPMLALSGSLDLRTPTPDAASVVSRFPQGHLLVVNGSGHSVLSNDVAGCAESAVHSWLDGRPVRERCGPQKPYLDPIGALPALTAAPKTRVDPRRTLNLVAAAVHEAEATWLLVDSADGHRAAGLGGGTLTSSDDSFTLDHYSLTPGIAVSGKLELGGGGPPLAFSGLLTITGPRASEGAVLLHESGRLEGMLGSRLIAG